jgi:hypothetical protein
LDLGITGPVGYPNPRIFGEDDVYQIPAGETGIFLSYSEAEYRVQWRNWDQDMMILSLGVTGAMTGMQGIIVEDPVNLMDDMAEGITRYFWDVDGADIREVKFSGTVVETSERVEDSVVALNYPEGMILLSNDDADAIRQVQALSENPILILPHLHLDDFNYQLYRLIIRELQIDNQVKMT